MKLKRDDADVDIDMSPMIDMVFLLLIFFIVTASQLELDKPTVLLPSSTAAKVPDNVTGRISVSIDRNKQIFINMVPVTMDVLKSRLKDELEKDPDVRILIRADEQLPYEVSKEMMLACSELGALNLIYSAFEK